MAGSRSRRTKLLTGALLCLSLGACIACGAQATAGGALAGKLTDLYAKPVDGAVVVMRNQSTGAVARTTTAKNGSYRFTGLAAGEYALEAESPQGGRARLDGILIAAGHEARMLTAMNFESAAPHPQLIQAALHDVDVVAPVVTTTLPGEQLQALPLSGRNWQNFALDTPTAATQAGGDAAASLRGANSQPAAVAVDGATRTLAFGSRGATGGAEVEQSRTGSRGAGESAIREVQAIAGNVEAEAAHAAGGRMNLETRHGTNGLHGQGFLYDHQNTWGAQNPFTQWVKETAPATYIAPPVFTPVNYTPPDHEITWGLGLGSQIRRDKLFWFGALDHLQRNDPGLATVKHPDEFFAQPSNDQMQVLSARLGLSSANPVVAGLSAYSPLLHTLGGLLGPTERATTQWAGFGRLDWQPGERHRLTLEGAGAQSSAPGGGLTRVSATNGSHSFGSTKATDEWLLARWEAFVTPNLLAVTQLSAGRTILSAGPQSPSAFEQTLNQNAARQLPQIVVDSRYGFTIGNPARFGAGSDPDEHLYEAQETVDWVHRGLLLKGGLDLSYNSDATTMVHNQAGTYTYATLQNFASDALAYAKYGLAGELDPMDQHNCDQTGRVWRDSTGQLRGLGYLPCYSYYTQTMGPNHWRLSTNDWAGFVTAQWQPRHLLTLSAAVRWELEQLPAQTTALANPDLPLTVKLPGLGSNWGPRLGLALGTREGPWPVLRLGYGMYFGRTQNATVETALTQTGSTNGDLNFFMRPTDNLNTGGAPPFPYVLSGEPLTMVKPGAVEFAPRFRNPEIHQALAALEETLPGHVTLTASALASLGRRLPISIDTNFDPKVNPRTITYDVVDDTGKGPLKSAQITVPFYASWPSSNSIAGLGGRLNPSYQQIAELMCRANSTYEAAMVKIARSSHGGLSLQGHYTYAHAMDWNPNETARVTGSDVLDPADFAQEYGTGNLDVRHSAALTAIWRTPWKLHRAMGQIANGWTLSGITQFRSGLPYTMRTSGSIPQEFESGTNATIIGLAPGMNASGGDNRVYGVGRNTYRYPSTWKADMRVSKKFDLGHLRELELLGESFNLFNHQNVTQLETTGYSIESGSISGGLPTLNFLTGARTNTTAFGQPLNINATNFYRERQIQIGLRMRF